MSFMLADVNVTHVTCELIFTPQFFDCSLETTNIKGHAKIKLYGNR